MENIVVRKVHKPDEILVLNKNGAHLQYQRNYGDAAITNRYIGGWHITYKKWK